MRRGVQASAANAFCEPRGVRDVPFGVRVALEKYARRGRALASGSAPAAPADVALATYVGCPTLPLHCRFPSSLR
jgi:hypothetical protein